LSAEIVDSVDVCTGPGPVVPELPPPPQADRTMEEPMARSIMLVFIVLPLSFSGLLGLRPDVNIPAAQIEWYPVLPA
jgi:hypothetical protein